MWDLNYKHLHIFVYNASCAVSCCLGRFLLSVLLDAFLFDLTLSITSMSPLIRQCSIATRKLPANSMAIFVASRSGGPNLVFHCSAA